MEKLITEQKFNKERSSKSFVLVLAAIVAILSVTRVFMANWRVESSETLRTMDQKIVTQTEINKELAQNLRDRESLVKIESQAKASGFVPLSKLSFVKPQPGMAVNLGTIIQDR